jgi:plasmid stabilization system protein ParE
VSLPVRTTPESDEQIRRIDDWWRSNRPAAPDVFLNELGASFDVIGHAPQIGRLYRRSPIPGTRRLLLAVSRYHVYYVPQAADVTVLAVWHARRGVGPPLRLP